MKKLRECVRPFVASVAKGAVTFSMLLFPFCFTTVFFHGAPALIDPPLITSGHEAGFFVAAVVGYLYLLGRVLPPGFWRDGGSPAEIDAAFVEAWRENRDRDRARAGRWHAAVEAGRKAVEVGREAYDAKKAELARTADNP